MSDICCEKKKHNLIENIINRRGISKLIVKITNVVAHLLVENILRHCKLVHLVFYPKMLTEKIVWKYFEFKDVHSLFLPEKNIPF